jgi:hypothetical protein
MRAIRLLYPLLLLCLGCASANVSPQMTFLIGLNHYQLEMARLESRPERWFDRQRLGESLKSAHLVTMGGSREFNQLVDLDVRKREFLITLRDSSLRAERAKEMRDELVTINRNIDDLKGLLRTQLSHVELLSEGLDQKVETVAAIGLLHLALERFSANSTPSSPRFVKIGNYLVADHGSLATVSAAEGETHRCSTILVPDKGAAIRCEPARGK